MENVDVLKKEDLAAIKGGTWIYDEALDQWFWVDRCVPDDSKNPQE